MKKDIHGAKERKEKIEHDIKEIKMNECFQTENTLPQSATFYFMLAQDLQSLFIFRATLFHRSLR